MLSREINEKEREAVIKFLNKHDPKPIHYCRLVVYPIVTFKDRWIGLFNEQKKLDRLCQKCFNDTTGMITKFEKDLK